MPAEKRVILMVASGAADLAAGTAAKKFEKKAAAFAAYTPGDLVAEALAVPGAAPATPETLAAAFEGETAMAVVALGNGDAAALDAALSKALEAADRRTLLVLAAANGLFLHGLGVNAKAGAVSRAVSAKDVLPTIAYVADLPVPADCTGAVIYQALKDPDMKAKEIQKLREALGRMEAALQRDNREPWDKHDCA